VSETAISDSEWRVTDEYREEWPDPEEAPGVMLDAMTDIFYVVDRRGKLRDWNERFTERLGYTDEEVAEMDPAAIVADEDARRISAALDRVASGEEVSAEVDLVTKDGEHIPHEFTAAPLTDDGSEVWGMVGTSRDITERKERERELEPYEQLLETVGDGAYVLDGDRNIEWVDDTLASMLGYDREELVGMHVSEVITSDPNDRGISLRERLEAGEMDVATIKGEMVRADGSTFPTEGRFSLLSSRDETVTIGLVRDISDRRERAELLADIHEATRELITAETKRDVAETAARVAYEDERLDETPPPYEAGEGSVGEAYEAGEPAVYQSGVSEQDTPFDYSPVESAILVPIEWYGMINLASLSADSFDDETQELAQLFATDVRTAFERADREERLRERERELEQYETLVETIGDGVFMTDSDRSLSMVNDALLGMLGYSREEMLGTHATAFSPDEDADRADEIRDALIDGNRRVATIEGEVERADGEMLTVETRFALLPGDEQYNGSVGVIRDVSDRKARAELLERLHEGTRTLQTAETTAEVADRTIEVANSLGFPTIVIRRLTDDGRLEVVEQATDIEDVDGRDVPTYEVGEGIIGRAYADGEVRVHDDLTDVDLKYRTPSIESAVIVPIEEYGVLAIGSTEQGAFDEIDRELARLLGADVASAFARADREEQLREREGTLQRQRDELETLNRINELIQGTIQAVASAATRDEIESTVCERLIASPFYRFAWTGARSVGDGTVSYRTAAGDGQGYLDILDLPADATEQYGPGISALDTGELQIVQDIESDPRFEPWREEALERGFRSVAVIPFRHGRTVHGVLTLYADCPLAFSDRECRAFEVLGDIVGFAISAIQNRRLIEDETVLELEITLPRSEMFFEELSRRLDCTCQLLGVVPSDETLLHYVTVSGASEGAVSAFIEEADPDYFESGSVVRSTDNGCIVAVRASYSTPRILKKFGGRTVDLESTPTETTLTACVPRDADVRALLDSFHSTSGNPVLEAKREVERDHYTDDAFRTDLADRLTERQDAALSAAYFGGYFDWPRESDAQEVAESLDISSATLHQHLRHAQRKLLSVYFDDLP